MVVAEYDSVEWHVGPAALLHDREKTARLLECGWTTIPITVTGLRQNPAALVTRIDPLLSRACTAS